MLEQTYTTPLPLNLEVDIPSGDIEIETADGEESRVIVDGDERLLADVEIRQDGNRIVVVKKGRVNFSWGGFFGRDDLRVRASLPHGANVKVKTASADTRVSGRLGALDVNAVSGDVHIRGDVTGDVLIKTVSGDAHLDGIGGKISAQTVSGDVRVGTVGGSVNTKTVSGDIRCEAVSKGEVRFTSVSGDIEIGIASGSVIDVDAGSTSGDLSSEVPLGSVPEPGAEGGGPTVVLRGRTTSGDVRIFRA